MRVALLVQSPAGGGGCVWLRVSAVLPANEKDGEQGPPGHRESHGCRLTGDAKRSLSGIKAQIGEDDVIQTERGSR